MNKDPFNDSFSPFDDGGADKSGDRRRRRRFRNIRSKIAAAVGGSILLIVIYRFHTRSSSVLQERILKPFQRLGVEKRQKQRHKETEKRKNARRKKQNNEERHTPLQLPSQEKNYDQKPKYRWADPRVLPHPPHSNLTGDDSLLDFTDRQRLKKNMGRDLGGNHNRKTTRTGENLVWDNYSDEEMGSGPKVDYTKILYDYPENILIPPRGGSYPPLEPLGHLMKMWPQNDIDSPPQPFKEHLQHFDYLDPVQMEAAVKYRDLEFPFKVYNVPEVNAATEKWTDEYLTSHFDGTQRKNNVNERGGERIPRTKGHCQQSVDSFFAFFYEHLWSKTKLGNPPTINNDFTFERFAKHARYADAVGLAPNEEHFYWQAGVPMEERNQPKTQWGMISRDLPSFSNPEPTFFGFNPAEQRGIQCRLGERGVAAATHYDGGRNMIAMITGAKRYILSPPNQCGKLGIVPTKNHPVFRHSLLNFGHINALYSDDPEVEKMSSKEREWLETSSSARAIETVLKAGEVLYCPSHWFHYIISLQKSAQCNTRSGRNKEGSPEWGGAEIVTKDCLGDS